VRAAERQVILFIHGFGSCGWGAKSLALRRHFGVAELLAPDLPFHPQRAIDHLQGMLERYPIGALVGSSLGGFYATALNAIAPRPTVLINPVIEPHRLLADYLGPQRRWCDDAPFDVGSDSLASLTRLQRRQLAPGERYLVLLQKGDEVLDYRQAAEFYAGKDVVVLPGGSHRFEQLARQMPRIAGWLQRTIDTDHRENGPTPSSGVKPGCSAG
jgi:predicted esterase YcpF (UPF0227 family)